jgi:tRNA pseudouridine55 synthase
MSMVIRLRVVTVQAAQSAERADLSGQRKQRGRDISGILLLDKPQGMSSNACLQHAKRLFQANKAGHTGALDPLATGVLPVCFGEATKVSQFLLDADKRYLTRIKLGQKTDTADAEGQVILSRPLVDVSKERIVKCLSQFRGEIEQLPPMYSALKHQGQPLYKLARAGQVVERKPRRIEIYEVILHDFSGDELTLEIHCSKGTYVRTIADDLGDALGCGGHVTGLRRLQSGVFRLADCVTPEQLNLLFSNEGLAGLDLLLRPADQAIEHLPALQLPTVSAGYVRQGQAVQVRPLPREGLVRLYDDKEFFGIGEVLDDGRVAPRRLMKEDTR